MTQPNLKIVKNSTKTKRTPSDIRYLIKQKMWATKEEVNIDDYVMESAPGVYEPDPSAIVQSRIVNYYPDFVDKKVRESRNGISYSTPAVVVYFPDETTINGIVIESNSYMGAGGTHGFVIDKYLGKNTKDAYVVNFEHDLNSSESNFYRLCNLLNQPKFEELSLEQESIREELYRELDKKNHDLKKLKKSFMEDYPEIDDGVWRNWVSNHKTTGGRRDPAVKHSEASIQAQYKKLLGQKCYSDYHVAFPRTSMSWETAVGLALLKACEKDLRKVVQTLYADNAAQTKALRTGKLKSKIETRVEELKEFYNMEDLKIIWMKF